MLALRIARAMLLVSVIVYLATLALAALNEGHAELTFLIGIVSVIGVAVSATACVVLQIYGLVRRRWNWTEE